MKKALVVLAVGLGAIGIAAVLMITHGGKATKAAKRPAEQSTPLSRSRWVAGQVPAILRNTLIPIVKDQRPVNLSTTAGEHLAQQPGNVPLVAKQLEKQIESMPKNMRDQGIKSMVAWAQGIGAGTLAARLSTMKFRAQVVGEAEMQRWRRRWVQGQMQGILRRTTVPAEKDSTTTEHQEVR